MIAITTSSSISVNPRRVERVAMDGPPARTRDEMGEETAPRNGDARGSPRNVRGTATDNPAGRAVPPAGESARGVGNGTGEPGRCETGPGLRTAELCPNRLT